MPDNKLVKRLLWSGLLAGIGALSTVAANKGAAVVWERITGEEPPDMS
ncbi:MAG TPA: hypothetical protein VGR10_06800 [Thermoleophilaceae bacterium]|nr:hypothetical protein [Thermoleophilaceae bacterium]